MATTRTALVLGATGGIGGEVTAALLHRDWTIRALHRNPGDAARRSRLAGAIEWHEGDAMRGAGVAAAARGAALIVHAVNPPGYRNWGKLVLPMMDNTIEVARASGARILLPGTIYNYGPDAGTLLKEESPQHPDTRKGAIRVEMERRLRAAAASGVRTLVVRAGDFFGADAANNWFSQGLVKPGKPLRAVSDPGSPGVGHAWAYLPDLAQAMADLVERQDRFGTFETCHFAGHWDADGTQMIAAIHRVIGKAVAVRRFPWTAIALASPVVPLFRELWEMRRLWREPVRLDNTRLIALLGHEPRTPLDTAVRTTLTGLGCAAEAR